MRDVLIVGSGQDISSEKLIFESRNSSYIIASDGGVDILNRYGIKPDIAIGDFDSIKSAVPENIPVLEYPVDKDLSDSEISLQHALSLNPSSIKLFGMTGDYMDHSFANILNLFRNISSDTKLEIITSNSKIFVASKNQSFHSLKNRRVSLFFFSNVSDFYLKGFRYNFNKTNLTPFDYSLSNVIDDDYAEINFNEGLVLCVLFDGGYE